MDGDGNGQGNNQANNEQAYGIQEFLADLEMSDSEPSTTDSGYQTW